MPLRKDLTGRRNWRSSPTALPSARRACGRTWAISGKTFRIHLEERREQYRRQLQDWKESIQELLDRDSFGQHRLFKAFPGLRSTRYKEALERLRRRMGQ